MKHKTFDYQGAKNEGYTDEDIALELTEKHPKFNLEGALNEGYDLSEINQFLSSYKPEKTKTEQAARVAGQFALGIAQAAALPYEIATIPLSTQGFHVNESLKNMGEDIEWLYEKNMGKPVEEWDKKDQELLEYNSERIKDPKKLENEVNPTDISIRGLTEKATGLDLQPEGILEHSANFLGFIKDPKKAIEFARVGLNGKQILKHLIPGTEEARALSVGTLMHGAEEGDFGPMGTMAAIVAGEVIGHAPKGVGYVVKNPKKAAAQAVNLFTGGNSKKAWTQDLIKDANELGIQLDAGTLTNSDLIKFAQARAVQSGLYGDDLNKFRENLSGQIIKSYEKTIEGLGELRFENNYQASEAIKETLKTSEINLNTPKNFKEQEKNARSLQGRVVVEETPDYHQELLNRIAPREFENSAQAGQDLKTAAQDIKTPIKEELGHRWDIFNEEVHNVPVGEVGTLRNELTNIIRQNEGTLLLGESAAEARVLDIARNLSERLINSENLTLNELIKTKRTLADVANWEFGGSNFESVYKKIVADIDAVIERSLEMHNPMLSEFYRELNAEYAAFKDMFENKNVIALFEPKNENYNAMLDKFTSNPDNLRSLEDIFYNSPRGQELVGQVKRDYARKVLERPNLSEREIRDLSNILGPQYNRDIQNFRIARQHAHEHPLPRARQGHPLELRTEISPTTGGRNLEGRVKESAVSTRKNMYDFLKNKESDQVLKMMDSLESIKKLKRALSLTPEGKELFKELSRYKLEKMIDMKMSNNITEQIKLGTFSKLLKTKEELAIARELLGDAAFNQLLKLQKVSGMLAESGEKFFNASKSGTVVSDVALISAGMTAVLNGNPFLFTKVVSGWMGTKVLTKLMADPKFLKYLEEAVMSKNPKKLSAIFEKMRPYIENAMLKTSTSRPQADAS